MTDVDVLVVGGGISGLATAWWLAQAGVSVEVWERADRAGGKIATDNSQGYRTERAAAMVMNFRPEINRLIEESGLAGARQARSATDNRYLIHKGVLEPVPMKIPALLASPLWSLRGKLRLLAEPWIPRGGNDGETVSDFVVRRCGREMLDKAMEPFVGGVLAADPDFANARATLPRLTSLEQRFGSITGGILMHKLLLRRTGCPREAFSFKGGMSRLTETLAAAPGVQFRPRHVVDGLAPHASGWCISGRGDGVEVNRRARHVVLCAPADCAAALLGPLDDELGDLLGTIEYAPLSVVHLGFAASGIGHPLNGAGFLVPRCEGLPLNGNLWMSSMFKGAAPAGKTLLSSYLGGARSPEAADWSDERSIDVVLAALSRVLKISVDPEVARIDRHACGLPQYNGTYPGLMRAVDARLQQLPGLHLEANYRGGVSVRDRIGCGFTAAARITVELRSCAEGPSTYPAGTRWRSAVTDRVPLQYADDNG